MRFTIKDRMTDRHVKLDILKDPRNFGMSITKDDGAVTLLKLTSERGKVKVAVDQNVADVGFMDGGAVPQGPAKGLPKEVDDMRNWVIGENSVTFFHPGTGEKIELKKASPGATHVPKGQVNEIYGQPGMVFSVAYALSTGRHSLLMGPTGTGKTTVYRWFAKVLGWNFILCPISRGTEAAHLVGDYMPTGQALFEWMHGPVPEAQLLSHRHPTLCVFDEINRIGNIAEFSRIYSVLDDTRMLELKERRNREGIAERIENGDLFFGATANPSDDEHADYIGVQDLDPALSSRFGVQPTVGYPLPQVEVAALQRRVPDADPAMITKMVAVATKIRTAANVRFPISFRELENWAAAYKLLGYMEAAQVCVVNKAPRVFHDPIMNILKVA